MQRNKKLNNDPENNTTIATTDNNVINKCRWLYQYMSLSCEPGYIQHTYLIYTVSGKTPRHCMTEMSNLNEFEQNAVHLISNKLPKWSPNCVGKYYFLAELPIVEYRSMKFGDQFRNLLGIKCTKCYSYSFRFDINVLRCLGVYFFPHTVGDFTFWLRLLLRLSLSLNFGLSTYLS